ncbi:MAG TPA: lysylphosphatidylglycerol synthase domain-containing protein [Alphaproteobacteria bacterium]|nr:lysylphosphatidylglycerol synthase domain-containing protein [Alphaproteobacteria bacterium]
MRDGSQDRRKRAFLVTPGTWTALAGLAGAALGLGLIAHYGIATVHGLIRRSGFGLVAIVALHCLQLGLTAFGWKSLLSRHPGLSSAFLFLVRWVREGVSTVLPLTPVGGVVVGVRLLCRRGIRMAAASAATVVDLSLELASQIVFAMLGLMGLMHLVAPSAASIPILAGLFGLTAMAAAFAASQWLGLARVAERMAGRLGMTGRVEGLHDAIIDAYRAPGALMICALLHLMAWLAGTFEVWLAMHFLGGNIGLGESFVIESLGQMLKTASFAIPAALGIQEGGYVLICGIFGVGPDLALALSLMKRLREIALGVPGIVVWLCFERRPRLDVAT